MLTTIKLPYKIHDSETAVIQQLMNEYSIIVRYSYNRFKEDMNEKDIRLLTKSLNSISNLNAWMIQCGIKEGKAVYLKELAEVDDDNPKKVIFGSKKNFKRRIKNLITNEKLKEYRLMPINIQGEKLQHGNRQFNLDIIDNNKIEFKVNKDKHIELCLPDLRNNIKQELHKLQLLNENKKDGYTYSLKIDKKNIYISYENFISESLPTLQSNRYIGIDLNPNEIGISIKDENDILYVKKYMLNNKINKHSKVEFELYQIAKQIQNLFIHYQCKFIFVEDLSIETKNHGNKHSNSQINNKWIRNKFINNLEKRITVLNGKLYKINPAYTSFIGNMMYNYDDCINASLEIARRGYEVIILKNKRFYPNLDLSSIKDQWKEYLIDGIKTWKDFFSIIKNTKLKYRVSLENLKFFSLNSYKSNVSCTFCT